MDRRTFSGGLVLTTLAVTGTARATSLLPQFLPAIYRTVIAYALCGPVE